MLLITYKFKPCNKTTVCIILYKAEADPEDRLKCGEDLLYQDLTRKQFELH